MVKYVSALDYLDIERPQARTVELGKVYALPCPQQKAAVLDDDSLGSAHTA